MPNLRAAIGAGAQQLLANDPGSALAGPGGDVAGAGPPLPLRTLPGRIFAEPMPGLGVRKARRSDRLAAAQTNIGMVLGG